MDNKKEPLVKVVAIANQKGGVGKTTTTMDLGIGLAKNGRKILLVDTDPQASLTISMGFRNPDGHQNMLGERTNIFTTRIPHSVRASEAAQEAKSIYIYGQFGKVATAYESLSKEVIDLELRSNHWSWTDRA